MSGGKEVSSTEDYDYFQEPDQLSQYNALKVVDALISLNDLELSPDNFLRNENLDEIKSPPLSGLKGAQCLTKTFSRSPIGKCDVFDSSYEDESGGDFFARKKECIFSDNKRSIKPSRALYKSEIKKDPFENGKDKTKFKALCNINISSLPDSIVRNPNNLLNSNSDKEIKNQKESEPAKNDNCSNQSFATKKGSLRCASQQKIVSSIGGTGSSNKLTPSAAKLNNGTLMTSYARTGDVSIAMVELVDEISKCGDNSGVKNSLNECESSSNSREKVVNAVEPLDKDKECIQSIARHTRQSRAEKSSNKTDVLLINDTCKMKYQRSGRSTQDRESSFEKNLNLNKHHDRQVDECSNLAKCRTEFSVGIVTLCQLKCKRICLREKMINGEKPLDKECMYAGIRSTPVARRTRQSRLEESSKKTNALLKKDTDEGKFQENGDFIQDKESSYEKFTVSNKRHNTQLNKGLNLAKCRTRSGLRLVTSCQPKRRRTRLNYAEDVDYVANPEFESELQRPKASFSVIDSQTEATMKNTLSIHGNPELETLHREEIQPAKMLFSSPLNKIHAVSPVHIDVNSMQVSNNKMNKSLAMSAIGNDLHRLKSSVAISTSALKRIRRKEDLIVIRVFFSHHLSYDVIEDQEKILSRFEIPVATSISEATHFIADKFSRTRNMLEAMAVGKPVVTHLWLESYEQSGFYIDEDRYILRDLKKEKEIGFIMPDSLACARKRRLLQDKKVFITQNVKPDKKTITNLVMASGGQLIERFLRSTPNDKNGLLVISCEEDCSICIPLLEKGLEVFTSELVLNGIVIQKLEYERHRLTTRLKNLIGNESLPETQFK